MFKSCSVSYSGGDPSLLLLSKFVFAFVQKLMTKGQEEALITTAKETKRNAQLTFIPVRITKDSKWKSSLSKKLSEETMKAINQQLNVEADDVIWLGFGSKESLVSLLYLENSQISRTFFDDT